MTGSLSDPDRHQPTDACPDAKCAVRYIWILSPCALYHRKANLIVTLEHGILRRVGTAETTRTMHAFGACTEVSHQIDAQRTMGTDRKG
jgi:hypothetical protein